MTVGIWVLGDQLWSGQAAIAASPKPLASHPPGSPAKLILIESTAWAQRRPYHYQKLVLVWSAMRHFAAEQEAAGWSVIYRRGEHFGVELHRVIEAEGITELRIMEPSDRPFRQAIDQLCLPCDLTWYPNNQFLWSPAEFAAWAEPYKQLRLENFYRAGRKRFDVLMTEDQPRGGQWNFDQQNRKPPPKSGLNPPSPRWFPPDQITQGVVADIHREGLKGFGAIAPFGWAVTRDQALAVLDDFIT
ncbi:MAG: cryptochrome/photolyase family protein, partial [Synechococcales cyanobacterium RM1_1_8]|nr:cryptochrome/photolyase family protein [Synechococcales cyanobacterium RM1_1_8]